MRRLLLLTCLATGTVSVVLGIVPAPAASADSQWVANHCYDNDHPISIWKRSTARSYAYVAVGEGYQYAGGCWNDNNRDDTPNLATYEPGGEGPDCSGFTFKSWSLVNNRGRDGGTWYDRFENVHGPYASYAFHDGAGPFYVLPNKARSTTLYMDAFARDGHVGMLYTNSGTDDGEDYIIEARCNDCGTNIWTEDWRGDSDYVPVRRHGWTPDCYPNCTVAPRHTNVVRVR
jgi:hypothetical protein